MSIERCIAMLLPSAKHPFFLGTQFHPEFTARPLESHPLFDAFIKAASKGKRSGRDGRR